MPANIVDARVDNFETVVKAAEGQQGPGTLLLILFLGDLVASTGESWCPDCSRAEPVIYEQVNGFERPVTMVRVYVGEKAAWRARDHPLRTDKRFRVTHVPTLVRWEGGAVAARLEADEADDEAKLRRLMTTTTTTTTTTRSRASSRSSSMSSGRGDSQSASSSPRARSKSSSSYTSRRTP